MYGAQTDIVAYKAYGKFENDVEMYGAQTNKMTNNQFKGFENDVEMYGAQTVQTGTPSTAGLRMM